jgi:hypothetical protein
MKIVQGSGGKELYEKLGCGSSDDVSRSVTLRGKKYYVTINRRLSYIGVSTLNGPTRFFAQGEEAEQYIDEYDRLGARRFIQEYDGYGFW